MPGGLLQLINKGDMDQYITGNPQISLFKSVYRRTTNFAIISKKLDIENDIGFGKVRTFKIDRDGDLLSKMYFNLTNTTKQHYPSNFGHYLIDYIELSIGGQIVSKIHGHWIEIWSRLSEQNINRHPLKMSNYMIPKIDLPHKNYTKYQQLACACGIKGTNSQEDKIILGNIQIPLPFWFCRNIGLALPLIALQYDVVSLKVKFSDKLNLPDELALEYFNFELWVDYVYLDTEERRRFAQVSHEYLIEQVQVNDFDVKYGMNNITFKYYHPVKELIYALDWNRENSDSGSWYQIGTIPSMGNDITLSYNINGNSIYHKDRIINFFSRKEIWEKHSGIGNIYEAMDEKGEGYINYADGFNNNLSLPNHGDSILVSSFSIKPEDYQPTGTMNFSAIDDVSVVLNNLKIKNNTLKVYAVNYNILRIMSGMGKLLYVN
jgi:hypothetical protein